MRRVYHRWVDPWALIEISLWFLKTGHRVLTNRGFSIYVVAAGNICGDSRVHQWSIFMVTSVASRCCRILFLKGRLHLPYQKANAFASCTPKLAYIYTIWCTRCTYVERYTGRCPGVQQHNGRITQTHLLKLNGGIPRMGPESSFWRDL